MPRRETTHAPAITPPPVYVPPARPTRTTPPARTPEPQPEPVLRKPDIIAFERQERSVVNSVIPGAPTVEPTRAPTPDILVPARVAEIYVQPARREPSQVITPAPVVTTVEDPINIQPATRRQAPRVEPVIETPAPVVLHREPDIMPTRREATIPDPVAIFTEPTRREPGTVVNPPEEPRTPTGLSDSPRVQNRVIDEPVILEDGTRTRPETGITRTEEPPTPSRNNAEPVQVNSLPVSSVETEPALQESALSVSPWAAVGAGGAGLLGGVLLEKLFDARKEQNEGAKTTAPPVVKKSNTLIYAGVGLLALFLLPKILKKR